MESESRESARAALESVADDRTRVAGVLGRETWWSAPAQGLAAGAFIAAPLAGLPVGMPFVMAVSSLAFFGIEHLARVRTRMSPRGPAGPGSLAVLILASLVLVIGSVTTMVLAIIGLTGWILPAALVGFAAMTLVSALYDRVYTGELRRAR